MGCIFECGLFLYLVISQINNHPQTSAGTKGIFRKEYYIFMPISEN
jgi:hypothetical protein